MKHILAGLILLAVCSVSTIEATSQTHIAGILRDEYALGLTPTLKSMGMGGAYLGIADTSSMNPAALGFVNHIEGTLTYGYYDHDAGPEAHRARLDAIFPSPLLALLPNIPFIEQGNWRVMVDGLMSDGSDPSLVLDPGGNPMDVDFKLISLGQQSGYKINDMVAFGIGAYPYERATVELGPLNGEALSQIGSVQLGTLVRPTDWLSIGGEFIYIKDDLEVSIPTVGHFGDIFHIHYFAIGAAITPWEGALIALDYWNGEIEGQMDQFTDFDQDVDRWNAGAQQRINDYLDLRIGSQNGGFTGGFTVHFNDRFDLDYAYVNKILRDKENVLGETEYHGLSVTMKF